MWECNIGINLKEGYEGVDWTELAQVIIQWRGRVYSAVHFQVLQKSENFFTS
jgi:hypothetical protein